jgi:hypothetical protein
LNSILKRLSLLVCSLTVRPLMRDKKTLIRNDLRLIRYHLCPKTFTLVRAVAGELWRNCSYAAFGLSSGESMELSLQSKNFWDCCLCPNSAHVPANTSLSTPEHDRPSTKTFLLKSHPHSLRASTFDTRYAMDYDPEGGAINVRFLQVHRPLCCARDSLANTEMCRLTTSAPALSSKTLISRLPTR